MSPNPLRPEENYDGHDQQSAKENKQKKKWHPPMSYVRMSFALPSTAISIREGPSSLLPEPCESGRVQEYKLPTVGGGGVTMITFPLRDGSGPT
jgi:hypothetical protein